MILLLVFRTYAIFYIFRGQFLDAAILSGPNDSVQAAVISTDHRVIAELACLRVASRTPRTLDTSSATSIVSALLPNCPARARAADVSAAFCTDETFQEALYGFTQTEAWLETQSEERGRRVDANSRVCRDLIVGGVGGVIRGFVFVVRASVAERSEVIPTPSARAEKYLS